jgi:hypothetical protein
MTLPYRSNTTTEVASVDDSRYETPGGAQNKADTALATANARISNIVADVGNSNSEIVDARFDYQDSTTYTSLSDRLNAMTEQQINIPRAEYTSNSDATAAYAVWTSPNWNVKVSDTDSFINPADVTKIMINTSGTYLIQANVTFAASVIGQRNLKIIKNVSENVIAYNTSLGSGNATRCNISTIAFFNAGEYFKVQGYQDDFPNSLALSGTKLSIASLAPT